MPADLPESEFRNEYSSYEGKCQWQPCKGREEIAMEIQHLPNAVTGEQRAEAIGGDGAVMLKNMNDRVTDRPA